MDHSNIETAVPEKEPEKNDMTDERVGSAIETEVLSQPPGATDLKAMETAWLTALPEDLPPSHSIKPPMETAVNEEHTVKIGSGTVKHSQLYSLAPGVDINLKPHIIGKGAQSSADIVDYDLVKKLGEGGMAHIHKARQTSLDRIIALKTIKPGKNHKETYRNLFLTEAMITAQLDHPNIVPIHDIGLDHDENMFYTMKVVQGESWEKVLFFKSQEENIDILIQVCDAIAFAHSHHIIHRDLKPDNIMLGAFGEVLVMDWGLATCAAPNAKWGRLTQQSAFCGTPSYMAPEMARGDIDLIGVRSDVYLLGAILYEIVTEKPPHVEKTALGCLRSAVSNNIAPTERTGELVGIALTAMATNPDDRYQSVQDMQQTLRSYKSHTTSNTITDKARRSLDVARNNGIYSDFNQAAFGFNEALMLWPENEDAREGLLDTQSAYAECALAHGDLDLARSLLSDEEPSQSSLLRCIDAAIHKKATRTRRLQRLKRLTLSLALLLVTVGTIAFVGITMQRNRAIAALAQAKRENYYHAIALAARKADDLQIGQAISLLDGLDPNLRHWEWGMVHRFCETSRFMETGLPYSVHAIAFHPDRTWCALACSDGVIRLRNPVSGQELGRLIGHTNCVVALEFDRSGQWLASGSWDQRVILWNMAEKKPEQVLPPHHWKVQDVTLSADNRLLISIDRGGGVRVWDLVDRCKLVDRMERIGILTGVAMAPDGQTVAWANAMGRVTLAEPSTLEPLAVLTNHVDEIRPVHLAFRPDNTCLAVGSTCIRLWDPRTRTTAMSIETPITANMTDLCFSPDGSLLGCCNTENAVGVWDVRSGRALLAKTLGHVAGNPYDAGALAFSRDGSLLAAAGLNAFKTWNTVTAGEYMLLKGHADTIQAIAFSPDGRQALSADLSGRLCLWDTTSGQRTRELLHENPVEDAIYAPQGNLLAVIAGHDIILYDASTLKAIRTISDTEQSFYTLCFTPDQRILVAGGQQGIVFRDVKTGEKISQLDHENLDNVHSIAVSPDSTLLAAGGNGIIVLWEMNGKKRWNLTCEIAKTLAFSPDGHNLTFDAGNNVGRVDVATGRLKATMKGHNGFVQVLAYSPDGRRLATGGDDTTIRIWDAAEQKELLTLPGGSKSITTLAFSPNQRQLISANFSGLIRLWTAMEW